MKKIILITFLCFLQNSHAADVLNIFGIEKLNEYVVPQNGIVLTKDTTIQAESIKLRGPILTKGFRLSLIAYNIHFENEGSIYTFQNENMPSVLEQCIPVVNRPNTRGDQKVWETPKYNQGYAANKSQDAHSGDDGADGVKGDKGFKGNTGSLNAFPINIIAHSVTGDVKIYGNGQLGAHGGDGGRGQNGQKGQQGGKGFATCKFIIGSSNKKRSGNGGDGGKAGAGGNGGEGGIGGLNAEINLLTSIKVKGIIQSLPGLNGNGGVKGADGNPGDGGDRGDEDHDKKQAKAAFVTITLCSEDSGVGRNGNQKSGLNGDPAVHGFSPSVNGEPTGCYNLRGKNKAVYQAELEVVGRLGSTIRQDLKKIYLLQRFYALSGMTLDSMKGLEPDEVQGQAKELKKIWKENFLASLLKSNEAPLGKLKDTLITHARNIVTGIEALEIGDVNQAETTFQEVNTSIRNTLETISKGTAKTCETFKSNRGNILNKALTDMQSSVNASSTKACIEANAFDDTRTDRNEVMLELSLAMKKTSAKYANFEELKTIHSLPYCDDGKLNINIKNDKDFERFLTSNVELALPLNANANGAFTDITNCHLSEIADSKPQIKMNMKMKSFMTDPDDLEVSVNATTFNERVVHQLMGSDVVQVDNKRISKLPAINLKNTSIKNIKNELFVTAIMLGGKK